jgi:hypothetical protein
MGPAGPPSDARTIVDSGGAPIGVIELSTGLVTRKISDDVLLLPVMTGGFVQGAIFYHTSSDCTGTRYLGNNGGAFAYYGQILGTTVFYTRLADPSASPSEDINSYETVIPGKDTTCNLYPVGLQSVGAVETVTDPALGAFGIPFRLKLQ